MATYPVRSNAQITASSPSDVNGTGWTANVHNRGITGSFGAYVWATCANVN